MIDTAQFFSLTRLVDTISGRREEFDHAFQISVLCRWTKRVETLGDLSALVDRFTCLVDLGARFLTGEIPLGVQLEQRLEFISQLNTRLGQFGPDFQVFKEDLERLSEVANWWKGTQSAYDQLCSRNFEERLGRIEKIVEAINMLG